MLDLKILQLKPSLSRIDHQTKVQVDLSYHQLRSPEQLPNCSQQSISSSQDGMVVVDQETTERQPVNNSSGHHLRPALKKKASSNNLNKLRDLFFLGNVRLAVMARDLVHAEKRDKYTSVSIQGDVVHYIIEPLYTRRHQGVLVSNAGRLPGYRGEGGATSYRVNAASNSYAGLIQPDEFSTALQELCLTTCMPQSDRGFSRPLAETLAAMIADFVGDAVGIMTPTGYTANLVAMSAITTPRTIWFMDSDSHNSMIVGARIAGAQKLVRFENNDFDDLERKILQVKDEHEFGDMIVAIEGLYSMTGSYPDLYHLATLKTRYGFTVFCDECHSFLALGRESRGIAEHHRDASPAGFSDIVDVRTSGLAKSAGAIGGYIGVRQLRYHEAIQTRLRAMETEGTEPLPLCSAVQTLYWMHCRPLLLPSALARLHHMADFVRGVFRAVGFEVHGMAGAAILGLDMHFYTTLARVVRACMARGVTIIPVIPPAAPTPRVRLCLSAVLTDQDVDTILQVLTAEGAECGLIPPLTQPLPTYHYPGELVPADQRRAVKQAAHDTVRTLLLETASTVTLTSSSSTSTLSIAAYDPVRVAAAGITATRLYGVGSGSAALLNGTFAPHVQLETTLAQLFGAAALSFNETRIAVLSTVNGMARRVKGYRRHVLLVPADPPPAVVEGLRSARRDKQVQHHEYRGLADLATTARRLLHRGGARTALTIVLDPAAVREGNGGRGRMSGTVLTALAQLLAHQTGRAAGRVCIIVDDREGITFRGATPLGIVSELESPSLDALSWETGVQLLVIGSLHASLGLPGAFVVGSDHLLSELRFWGPGACYSTSAPPMLCAMANTALETIMSSGTSRSTSASEGR